MVEAFKELDQEIKNGEQNKKAEAQQIATRINNFAANTPDIYAQAEGTKIRVHIKDKEFLFDTLQGSHDGNRFLEFTSKQTGDHVFSITGFDEKNKEEVKIWLVKKNDLNKNPNKKVDEAKIFTSSEINPIEINFTQSNNNLIPERIDKD